MRRNSASRNKRLIAVEGFLPTDRQKAKLLVSLVVLVAVSMVAVGAERKEDRRRREGGEKVKFITRIGYVSPLT